jgi:hypothetical protein
MHSAKENAAQLPMMPARTFPPVQKTPVAPMSQPGLEQPTLDAITAYTNNMQASVASYRNAMQTLLVQHSEQCSAMIAMQQQYITEREALHHRQMKELIDSFQCRYQHLEAHLTAEQMENFRRYMEVMQGDLDLWSADTVADEGQISAASIKDFLSEPAAEDITPFAFGAEVEE